MKGVLLIEDDDSFEWCIGETGHLGGYGVQISLQQAWAFPEHPSRGCRGRIPVPSNQR